MQGLIGCFAYCIDGLLLTGKDLSKHMSVAYLDGMWHLKSWFLGWLLAQFVPVLDCYAKVAFCETIFLCQPTAATYTANHCCGHLEDKWGRSFP